ncbi:MAG: serine/threonine-protein kinase [Polyangiaceae bacterium]
MSQLLKALIEAHQLGIVHRDIKPANVLICPIAGDPDFTKLLDFGIAKSIAPNIKALTAPGEILGTPSYMSPEHIEARPVGPPSDVYSVGLLMSEMLSGRRVYAGSAIDVCLQQVSHHPAPLPPEATGSLLGPVIARATAKRMQDRFATAAEMLEAIDRALSGRALGPLPPAPPLTASGVTPVPVSASNPSLPAFSSPALPVKRSYLLHVILGCVAIALLAAIAIALRALLAAGAPPARAPAAVSAPRQVEIRPVE